MEYDESTGRYYASEIISRLRPGDIVAIVQSWDGVDEKRISPNGEMDKWLGAYLTVESVSSDFITVVEDDGDGPVEQGGHWLWYADMIDRIMPGYVKTTKQEIEYEIASESDMMKFLFGGAASG